MQEAEDGTSQGQQAALKRSAQDLLRTLDSILLAGGLPIQLEALIVRVSADTLLVFDGSKLRVGCTHLPCTACRHRARLCGHTACL